MFDVDLYQQVLGLSDPWKVVDYGSTHENPRWTIFSSGFADSPRPDVMLGANLVGAMLGGFAEYLSMAVGSERLFLAIIGSYLASAAFRWRTSRGNP